jgi:hypothetical protein
MTSETWVSKTYTARPWAHFRTTLISLEDNELKAGYKMNAGKTETT